MILGYGDESEGTIFSLSACILEHYRWQKLTDEWASILKEPPEIEYFHMKEARELSGQFSNLSATQRDMKLIRLVTAVMNYGPRVISVWVLTSDYFDIVGKNYSYETRNPYFCCFLYLLWFTAHQSKSSKVQLPVDFTFDDKGRVGENALHWFRYAKKAAGPELVRYFGATPVFGDDEKLIPLQVADLVAWHVHRKLESPGPDIERIATERIDELPKWSKQLTKDDLQSIAGAFAVFFDEHPLSFVMKERPGRRRWLWKRLQKQFQRSTKDGGPHNSPLT